MNIEIKNLSKKIGNINILKNINLTFAENIHILIGENGAGKTTLLRIIALLDTPTEGVVKYDGKPCTKFCAKDKLLFRRNIGFVFQEPIILEGTVWENVVLGLRLRKLKIKENKVKDIVSQMGLQNKIYLNAKKLSGGEKQRLQLARVLAIDPSVYILDEPTANLDPLTTKKIEEVIVDGINKNKTVILSTHNLLQAQRLGEKIFFLKEGEVKSVGSPQEIFETPTSKDIVEFSQTENIVRGEIKKDGEENYLLSGELKISVLSSVSSGQSWGIIKPEDILISKDLLSSSARNCFEGTVKKIENVGALWSVTVRCNNLPLVSYITKQSAYDLDLKIGDRVYLIFKATSVNILQNG